MPQRHGHAQARDPLRPYAAAAAAGDDVAVAELVRRTEQAVSQVCAVLGSPGELEDLVQETYLRALRALPRYRGDAPVRLWLLSIARRTCADHVRRRQRQRRLVDRLATEAAAGHDAAAAEWWSPAADLLDRLDADRREAFALTQLAGLSYEEAAAVAGCPIGTIRSRVARARADLRAVLDADAAAG
jgi:RNA polymerase sigma-70 factor (ECF subfamily)